MIRGKDGYQYEPVWLSPKEAGKRGIKHGDIVKVFNERGIVLCAAYVTERLNDNTCYIDHGSRLDPIIPGGAKESTNVVKTGTGWVSHQDSAPEN